MIEDEFVNTAHSAALDILTPPLRVRRGAALLYQVTVDNRLELTVNPQNPKRGQAAFQTDLCVFDSISEKVAIPRVVLEFKSRLTTHDVLTYSAKARKHKQVYPYLRYGIVIGNVSVLPRRLFTHNEALDFAVAAASYKKNRLHLLFEKLLRDEVAASRQLEAIAFGGLKAQVFRTEVKVETNGGTVA